MSGHGSNAGAGRPTTVFSRLLYLGMAGNFLTYRYRAFCVLVFTGPVDRERRYCKSERDLEQMREMDTDQRNRTVQSHR